MTELYSSVLIGVAGETASGKTAFCNHLQERSPIGSVAVLALDSYYRCQAGLPTAERESTNFDHPDAFDYPLLVEHVGRLHRGMAVNVPIYDFTTHTRSSNTFETSPAQLIVVEGILTLYWGELRDCFDLRIFIEAPEDLRLKRRIDRDMRERGRTRESILRQWEDTVLPMTEAFCTPTRKYADLVVSGQQCVDEMVDAVLAQVTSLGHK